MIHAYGYGSNHSFTDQEVLDFCAANGVTPEIELISIEKINDAYKAVESGDVRFRYVIDMSTLQPQD